MAHEEPTPPHPPSPDRLIQRMRVVSIAVILGLLIFIVIVDSLGRLLIDPMFRVSEIFLTALLGALTLALGIEITSRLPKGGE